MTAYGPFENVFVETDWYDGPRAGIANVNGQPHRFVSQFDEDDDEYLGSFLVWPVDAEELTLEQEQWRIFVAWNELYEAGVVEADTHPGLPGKNERWRELASLLAPRRLSVPVNARRAKAHLAPIEQKKRYESIGPGYRLSWTLL